MWTTSATACADWRGNKNEKGDMGVKGVKLGKETETEPEMKVWNGAADIMTYHFFFFLKLLKFVCRLGKMYDIHSLLLSLFIMPMLVMSVE